MNGRLVDNKQTAKELAAEKFNLQRQQLAELRAFFLKKYSPPNIRNAYFDQKQIRRVSAKYSDERPTSLTGASGFGSTDRYNCEIHVYDPQDEAMPQRVAQRSPSFALLRASEHTSEKRDPIVTLASFLKVETARNKLALIELDLLTQVAHPDTERQIKVANGMIFRMAEMMERIARMGPDIFIDKEWVSGSEKIDLYLAALEKTRTQFERVNNADAKMEIRPRTPAQ